MPKRRAEDTPGMIMTDHLIQRRPPPGDLVAEIPERPATEYRGEIVPYYPAPLPQTGENALYRAVAQVGLQNNLEAGLPELAREIQRQKPREAEFYIVLGDAWRNAGNSRQAVSAYEEAVRLNAGSVRALRALSAALEDAREPQRVMETLKQALRIAPSDPETWYRYGLLDSSSGRKSDAIERVRKAIAIDPSLPEKSRRLADLLANAGQWEAAEAAAREALRIDPYDEDAWDLSGRILSEKGESAEAMYAFERAVSLRPGSATFLYDYGLALARSQRFDEAQAHAEAAIRADPKHAESHELLGGLFEKKKQWADAAREYRQAIEFRPESARVHLRLGSVLAAQGDVSGAREHLRKASQGTDPAAAREAARALQQLGGR
jgi:tetratricopeptide (TPR) repeat protein